VLYFGAGRGPLIHRALNAAKLANATNVKVVALDKNPNAIVTLRNMIRDAKLEDRVKLISHDMRHLAVDSLKGDILMSELLGSFGDNELSPECLNPTVKFLKPGGIFVPWSYTNHVVPLSSKILWNEVLNYSQQGASANVPKSQQLHPYELPYVVKIYNATFPCGRESKDVFTFRHLPYPDDESLKELPQGSEQPLKQFGSLSFEVKEESAEIHGFAGYFTAELYQDVFYSIQPEKHTPLMHSWFPLYFPIKNPLIVYKGQQIKIFIWRNSSSSKVWYEWAVSQHSATGATISRSFVHNVNGRGYSIGL
jgi:protein arginine N-methyltransferase 5